VISFVLSGILALSFLATPRVTLSTDRPGVARPHAGMVARGPAEMRAATSCLRGYHCRTFSKEACAQRGSTKPTLGTFSPRECTDYLLRISFRYGYDGRDVRFMPRVAHCRVIRDPASVKIVRCRTISIRKVACCFIQVAVDIVALQAPQSSARDQRSIVITVQPDGNLGWWTQ
jgi:hypothetical protein